MAATATAQLIREYVTSGTEIRVNEDEGVIYNVRVLGVKSKNGRTYSERARKEALGFYEGVEVNISHRDDDDAGGNERPFLDGVGILTRPRAGNDGAVYADLPYLKAHPLAGLLVEKAKRFPTTFGLSHEAEGDVIEGGADDGTDLVESILHVESVDFVRKPATNNGLFESHRSKPMKSTVLKVLEKGLLSSPTHAEGTRLKKLLESQEMTAVAGSPAAEGSGDADSQVAAAFEQAVVAVLRGDGDKAAKMAKIKKILAAEESLAADTGAGKPGEGGDKAKPADASESAKLAGRLNLLERRDSIRRLCVTEGVNFDALPTDQQTLLEGQKDDASVQTILESWPKQPTGPKPVIRSKVKESEETGSYDDMVKRRGW